MLERSVDYEGGLLLMTRTNLENYADMKCLYIQASKNNTEMNFNGLISLLIL